MSTLAGELCLFQGTATGSPVLPFAFGTADRHKSLGERGGLHLRVPSSGCEPYPPSSSSYDMACRVTVGSPGDVSVSMESQLHPAL